MPRTAIPVTQLANFDGVASTDEFKNNEVAADTVNGNSFVWTGREALICRNSGASPRTISVTSVPVKGRSGDVTTYPLAAGESHTVPPLPAEGWRQADGMVYVDGSHAEVKFTLLRMPPNLPL